MRLYKVLRREGTDVWTLGGLPGSDPGGPDIRVVDVVDDTMHWEGFVRISPQGGP